MRDCYILRNRVARYRRLKGFSQTELAMAVGVSKNTISSIETGAKEPSTFISLAISDILNIPVHILFYLDLK